MFFCQNKEYPFSSFPEESSPTCMAAESLVPANNCTSPHFRSSFGKFNGKDVKRKPADLFRGIPSVYELFRTGDTDLPMLKTIPCRWRKKIYKMNKKE
jgi:hypothetical protein